MSERTRCVLEDERDFIGQTEGQDALWGRGGCHTDLGEKGVLRPRGLSAAETEEKGGDRENCRVSHQGTRRALVLQRENEHRAKCREGN